MKETGFKNLRSRSLRPGRIRTHVLPVLIWMAAIVGIVVLFRHRAQRFEVLGLAQVEVRQIAPTCRGRLVDVPVHLFQKVSQGQTLAVFNTVLDDEHLEAELATLSAEIQHLVAQSNAARSAYVAEVDTRRSEWVAERRAFAGDVVTAKFRVLELTKLLESDRVMLEDLGLDIKRFIFEAPLETDDAAVYELQKMKVKYNALAKKIEENERLLNRTQQELKEALQREDEFVRNNEPYVGVSDKAAQDLMLRAMKVLEQRMDELNARREELVLKSPFDGVIRQIQGRVGEAVLPGRPVLTVAETIPRQIITYASQEQAKQIQEGTRLKLLKTGEPVQIASSHVVYLGPNIEQIPARLWRNPNIPQWGRPVLIEIPQGFDLVPGEVVGIRGL
jgi:multidrug resistance efflux pump